MQRVTVLIIILLFSTYLFSQKQMKLGIEAMKKEQFAQAIEYFDIQIRKKSKKKNIVAKSAYYAGYCNKKLSLPIRASLYFKKAIDNGYNDPIVYLYLGEAYQMQQKYDSALINYEYFKRLAPEHKMADFGIESIKFTFDMIEKPTNYQVKIKGRFNSGEYDYCPFFEVRNFKKIYFTSTRHAPTHVYISPESGEYCSNIFYSEKNKDGIWSDPLIVPGLVNSNDEEGASCLNHKSSNLYFTRCKYDKNLDKGCRIYVAKRGGSYWGQIKEVEIPGIPKHVSIGHPAISDDELTLYFVADSLLGGLGGKDIYKVTRLKKNQAFGKPQNLGDMVNTEADEVHPYIRENGDLYFSSDGHPGMGGLDIFKAEHIEGAKYKIQNMGYPLNSSHDDFGIVFMGMKEEGFISSRRVGGMGKTDLYHFLLPEIEFTVKGVVTDKYSNKPVSGVSVQLMNDEFELVNYTDTDEFGQYYFDLEAEQDYTLYFKKKGYSIEKVKIKIKDIKETKHFIRDVILKK